MLDVIEDILDIWEVIDRHHEADELKSTFVAADTNRLPSMYPMTFDIKFTITTVLQLRKQASSLKNVGTRIDKLVEEVLSAATAAAM